LDPATIIAIFLLLIIVAVILSRSVRVVREWERAIILRLGKYRGIKGPGLIFLVPFIDRAVIADLRLVTVDVPKQEAITKDNVTVVVDAVVYYRIVDPESALLKVKDPHYAVSTLAMTSLRDMIGQVELDELLTKREEINKRIQSIVDRITEAWGVKVTAVTLKSIELPEGLIRAMSQQAEAERLRRARIIQAEAEREAAKILAEAAMIYAQHPQALRLRELQTYIEIAREKNLILITEGGALSSIGSTIAAAKALLSRESSEAEKK